MMLTVLRPIEESVSFNPKALKPKALYMKVP